MGEFLKWLAPYAPGAQFFAYVFLTIASVTVAATQLFLAYRQNFGWRPLVLLADQFTGLINDGGAPYTIGYMLEVWNRRRYPIVVRSILIDIKTIEPLKLIRRTEPYVPEDWAVRGDSKLYKLPNEVVEPASHKVHTAGVTGSIPVAPTILSREGQLG